MKETHPTKVIRKQTKLKADAGSRATATTATATKKRRIKNKLDDNGVVGAIRFSTSNNLKCYGQQPTKLATTTATSNSRRSSPNTKPRNNKIAKLLTNGSSSPKKPDSGTDDNKGNAEGSVDDDEETRLATNSDHDDDDDEKAPVTTPKKRTKTSKQIHNNSSTNNSNISNSTSPKRRSKKNGKHSPELRPRRRASQTYFFKYQLARNPLKAEEEDLKLALIASLEQCGGDQAATAINIDEALANTNSNDSTTSMAKKYKRHAFDCQKNTAVAGGRCTCRSRDHVSHRRHLMNGHSHKHRNTHRTNPRKKLLASSNCVRGRNLFGSNYRSSGNISDQERIIAANSSTSRANQFDEEYLNKYKPETEDFLTFICFRINTAQNHLENDIKNGLEIKTENGIEPDNTNLTSLSNSNNNNNNNNYEQSNDEYQFRSDSPTVSRSILNNNDSHILRQQTTPTLQLSTPTPNGSQLPKTKYTGKITDYFSPSNRRRPTRQSPRLAGSSKKISENDNTSNGQSNYNCNNTAQDYHHKINYQEDMRKASMALEDMAQEIIRGKPVNGFKQELIAQNTATKDAGSISTNHIPSTSALKNNKHLVKGLMTREFAGGFADEEIIFESISKHKL